MKKIVFCISSLRKGGAERVISILANKFSEKYQTTILLFENSKIEYNINNSVKIIKLDKSKRRYNIITKKTRFFKYFWTMKSFFRKENPDYIVSFLPKPSFLSILTKNKKSKIIVSVRNDPKIEYNNLIDWNLMKWLYSKADGIVFQTKAVKMYFESLFKMNSKIIYNPISDDIIKFKIPTKKRNKEIVSVGRLEKQKNFPLLINSFAKLDEKYNDYKLIIYGEGSKRKELEALIKKMNLGKRILLPGQVDNVQEKIVNASLFVLSSDFEGMPNCLIEAMALGIPVISTDCPCGGPGELIENEKNGILIDVGNEKALKKEIEKVLSDQVLSKKMSNNAINIKSYLNSERIFKEWESFLNEV